MQTARHVLLVPAASLAQPDLDIRRMDLALVLIVLPLMQILATAAPQIVHPVIARPTAPLVLLAQASFWQITDRRRVYLHPVHRARPSTQTLPLVAPRGAPLVACFSAWTPLQASAPPKVM